MVVGTPLPFLKTSLAEVKSIEDALKEAQLNKVQLGLYQDLANLLLSTFQEEAKESAFEDGILRKVKALEAILRDMNNVARVHADKHFLKTLWTQDDTVSYLSMILARSVHAARGLELPIDATLNGYQLRDEQARAQDADQLHNHLLLCTKDNRVLETSLQLNKGKKSTLAILSALQKRIDVKTTNTADQRFLRKAIEFLHTKSGLKPDISPWLITSFEVELANKIGTGGFATVWKGKWAGSVVAVKVLKTSSALLYNEIKIWEQLRHPHVIQLYGASTVDDPPFLVMPYLKNGHVRDFLRRSPRANRARLAQEIALGLEYLHSRSTPIWHGDLRSLNVLIDYDETAVLADFGLAEIRSEVSDKATEGKIYGALAWMAPERISKKPLTGAVDVYAFGVTVWEMFSGALPFEGLDEDMIPWLVVEKGQRPTRPMTSHIIHELGLDDKLWSIVSSCWAADPTVRPTAASLASSLGPFARRFEYLQVESAQSEGSSGHRSPYSGTFSNGTHMTVPPSGVSYGEYETMGDSGLVYHLPAPRARSGPAAPVVLPKETTPWRDPSPPPFANLALDDRQPPPADVKAALRVQAISQRPMPTSATSTTSSVEVVKPMYGGRGGAARMAKAKAPKPPKEKKVKSK